MLALLLALVLTSQPAAASCPWGDASSVRATARFGVVSVNGTLYRVLTPKDIAEFAPILEACDANVAADALGRWRLARGVVLSGAVLAYPMPVVGLAVALPGLALCLRSRHRITRDIHYSGERASDGEIAALEHFE